jgi:hypothetical protein
MDIFKKDDRGDIIAPANPGKLFSSKLTLNDNILSREDLDDLDRTARILYAQSNRGASDVPKGYEKADIEKLLAAGRYKDPLQDILQISGSREGKTEKTIDSQLPGVSQSEKGGEIEKEPEEVKEEPEEEKREEKKEDKRIFIKKAGIHTDRKGRGVIAKNLDKYKDEVKRHFRTIGLDPEKYDDKLIELVFGNNSYGYPLQSNVLDDLNDMLKDSVLHANWNMPSQKVMGKNNPYRRRLSNIAKESDSDFRLIYPGIVKKKIVDPDSSSDEEEVVVSNHARTVTLDADSESSDSEDVGKDDCKQMLTEIYDQIMGGNKKEAGEMLGKVKTRALKFGLGSLYNKLAGMLV